MKNIIKALVVITVFCFFGISCNVETTGNTEPAQTTEEKEAEENAAKVAAAKEALAIPAETDSDIDLPLVLNGVSISWISSNEELISSAGLVTQQLNDLQVTLTAKLSLGNAVETREFLVMVAAVTFAEEEAELVEVSPFTGISSALPWLIKMKGLDVIAVFDCTTDSGFFYRYPFENGDVIRTRNINVDTGGEIVWWNREIEDYAWVYESFIEIVIKLEGNNIGYTVFILGGFTPFILKSVLFPKINGEYQNISEDYIKNAIENIKTEVIGG